MTRTSGTTAQMAASVRILLADDDPAMRAYVSRVLTSSLRADVTEVGDGVALLTTLALRGPFHLVVTDVRMPWLDGARALVAARQDGLAVPFLVFTAFADADLRASIEAVPDAQLLDKPFTTGALIAAVRDRLGWSAGIEGAVGHQA